MHGEAKMNKAFKKDWKRYKRIDWSWKCTFSLFKSETMRYIFAGRLSADHTPFAKLWGGVQKYLGNKMGCEIGWANIESGLVLAHPYGITVNGEAKIGKDCTLFKGCTIGGIRGGERAGAPTLGARVVICSNAMVCGNISVGNDVLIAAGTFVNFDVPDNSVVIGNPGIIHYKVSPTKYYM